MVVSNSRGLIENLQRPELFDHVVIEFHLIETHISFLLLTGDFAYKIKKPVNLGFVDFTTLAKRKFFCEEELRLNRRMTPELYVGVVAVTGTHEHPHIGGADEIIEYAVKMRQFSEADRLDHMVRADRITPEHIDELAEHVAEFHHHAAVATPGSGYSTADQVRARAMDNFPHIRPCVGGAESEMLDQLQQWTRSAATELTPAFNTRLAEGSVRECHGDMHLANMVLFDGCVHLFDCLEFNPQLRWIDVASDVSFAMMDLVYHQHEGFAHRLWKRYVEITGDYAALSVRRYYLAYRALVRAKVACIQDQQGGAKNSSLGREVAHHLTLADYFTRVPARKPLIIAHGLSGSGKTWLSEHLVERTGVIHIRSDVERRRTELGGGERYSASNIARVYRRLLELARQVLGYGYPVVVDATFLRAEQRRQFRNLALGLGIPFHILHCEAVGSALLQRVRARAEAESDASEATEAVLKAQMNIQEPLSEDEIALTISVDTTKTVDWTRLIKAIELDALQFPTTQS